MTQDDTEIPRPGHHTVATMASGLIALMYAVYVIGNVLVGLPPPDSVIFTAASNAIVVIVVVGYYRQKIKAIKELLK